MPSKSNSTKKKTTVKTRRINWALALVFVLIFTNIGVATQLFSHANTSTNKVNLILFCAPNVSCSQSTQTTKAKITENGSVMRSWYNGQVGRTFSIGSVTTRTAAHYASWYSTYSGNVPSTYSGPIDASVRTYYNVYKEIAPTSSVKDIVVLGFKSLSNCGVGGGALSVVDPLHGCSSVQPTIYAHELGHDLGLRHTGTNSMNNCDQYSSLRDGTLMDCYYACRGSALSNCDLNNSQASSLYNNAWFVPATTTTTTTTTKPTNPYSSSCPAGSEATVGYGYTTSGKCVYKLQWGLNKAMGTSLAVDGLFGSNTNSVLRSFQTKYSLGTDGIAGPKTWAKLDTFYY